MTPQPNPIPHLERFDRILNTANQLLTQTQQQAMEAGRVNFLYTFIISKIQMKQIQANFEELTALTQALKLNLDNIKDSLPKEANHE